MTLNIKTGDWAVLRNGEIHGPIVQNNHEIYVWECDGILWTAAGEFLNGSTGASVNFDIIATLPCPPIERIRQLEEALRFYASVEDYEAPLTTPGKLWLDTGETARRALGEQP